MTFLSWLSENWQTLIGVCGTVVMGSALIVKAIAPLTKTVNDDRLLTWLEKAHNFFSRFALNPKPEYNAYKAAEEDKEGKNVD